MKKVFNLVALATMLVTGLASCTTNDDVIPVVKEEARPGIGFDIHTDGSTATRGYAVNSTNVATVLPDFQTWAYDDVTDVLYMGTSATGGKTVTNTNMDGTAWNYAPPQFWPANALNFVAIAPAAPNGVTANATASADNVVTLTSSVSLSTNVEDQDDIMYAEADGITSATDGGNVPFTFKHALSQIVFRGKFNDLGAITKITIAEIALGGVNKAGTLVFNSEGQFFGSNLATAKPATSTPAVFSLDASDLEGSVWDVSTAGTTPFDLTVSNNATKKNAWMLLPQTTAAWDGTSYTAGVPTSGAYIKLRVKLEKDGVIIKNNAEADAIYLPLAVDWNRSTKYIYTIEFNGDNLTPITFSVAAENWTEEGVQVGEPEDEGGSDEVGPDGIRYIEPCTEWGLPLADVEDWMAADGGSYNSSGYPPYNLYYENAEGDLLIYYTFDSNNPYGLKQSAVIYKSWSEDAYDWIVEKTASRYGATYIDTHSTAEGITNAGYGIVDGRPAIISVIYGYASQQIGVTFQYLSYIP